MNICLMDEIVTDSLEYQDLVSYLSQIILSKTNEEVEDRHKAYLESQRSLSQAKNNLKERREKLLEASRKLSRLRILAGIVSMIDGLKRETVLYGSKKVKILRLLGDLETKSYPQLRSLEEKLRIHIPGAETTIA